MLALPFTAASCCIASRAIGIFTKSEKPVWEADLRKSGFKIPFGGSAAGQMAFGSNKELVVLNDSGPSAKPNPVHAFVLETSAGRQVGQADWVGTTWPRVYATAGGGYAIVTDHGTDLYSPGLKEVVATSRVFVEHASPDGRVFSGITHPLVPGHAVTAILDSDSLKPTGIEVVNTSVESISDDRVSSTGYRSGSPYMSVITRGTAEDLIY